MFDTAAWRAALDTMGWFRAGERAAWLAWVRDTRRPPRQRRITVDGVSDAWLEHHEVEVAKRSLEQ